MYRVILANGYVHEADDERKLGEMVDAVVDPYTPSGWCLLAGLYVRASEVVAICHLDQLRQPVKGETS